MEDIILGILFAITLITYCFYKRRLNDFLLYKIDYIIVFILLLILFKIRINQIFNKDLIFLFFGISAFFIGFQQFRKNKEIEIINKYINNRGEIKSLENLIVILKVSLPIVGQNRNIINIILTDIIDLFGKNENNTDKILKIKNAFGGDGKEFTRILKHLKKLEEKNLSKVKCEEGRKKIQGGINKIENFIKALEDSREEFYYKTRNIDKIINFLTP